MNYTEYNTEYLKVMAKQSLKMLTETKQRLIGSIENTDNLSWLDQFLRTTDFESFIATDEMHLLDLERMGKADEFRELIEQDIKTTILLKETAENRLKELKERDKYKDEPKEDLESEQDEQLEKRHGSKRERISLGNNLEYDQETQHIYCEPVSMIRRDGPVLALLKRSVISSINGMRDTKMNVDRSPSLEVLIFMSNSRELYDQKTKKIAQSYIDMPECDEELRMLCEQLVIAGEQVNETVDRHIAKYEEKGKQNSKGKDGDGTSLEERKERLQQDDSTPKKSWELPPKQKEAIQSDTWQLAQKHMEEQAKPQQPEIEASINEIEK